MPNSANSMKHIGGGSVIRPDILTVSLVMHILGLALPLALLQIYDRILPSQSYGTATFLVIGVGIAILLEATLRFGRQALFIGIGARYEAQATIAALDRLQRADIAEVERRGTAALTNAIKSIGQVRDFWSGQSGAALYELPFVILYIGLIAYIGGWLALIPLMLCALAIVFVLIWGNGIAKSAKALEQHERRRQDFTWSLFGALGYLKAIGSEASLGAIWRRLNKRQMEQNADLEARLGWVRENATAFGQLSTALIVAFGAIEVINGQLTTGALAACTMLAGRSIGPAMASLGYWSQLARVGEAKERVRDLIELPLNQAFTHEDADSARSEIRGEIRIEAPSLLPEPVTIEAGEVVHLVSRGAPYASRLMTAISGMSHDPDIHITVDGCELGKFGREHYRESVMLVSRQLALVPGSILNNLTLYDPRYNASVPAYCEALGLQSHIDKLRSGVLTEVGPGTAEHLDEGVYQRIAIIRALLRKPRILLLDHAASGLDLDGVKRLAAVLNSLQGHTTVLVSSYRAPLIAACTRSLTLGPAGGAE